MKFSVKERFLLLSILNPSGSLSTLRLARKLREDLSFSDEEHEQLGIEEDPVSGQVKWDQDRAVEKEVEVGPKMREVITATFKQLDAEERLDFNIMPLAERFLGGEEVASDIDLTPVTPTAEEP
jgi:hypothetical protein